MSVVPAKRAFAPLNKTERIVAAVAGGVLLGVALLIVVMPPGRQVALGQCPNAAAGCVVTVDHDLTTFGAVLAAAGAAAVLLAILGVRFNRLKVGGTELGYENETAGLTQAEPAGEGEVDTAAVETTAQAPPKDEPIEIAVKEGLGGHLGAVPVAVAQLTEPMREVDPSFLQDYRWARRSSQRSHFLTHILGPAKHSGQKYSVAIRVTRHKGDNSEVKSASFYLGPAWGDKVFEGRRGADGRFGITTEAYGPFLALCEIEFLDGTRVLLDHYCDFDMGSLLPT